MNFLGYIIAIGYYTAVPLTLFLQSFHDEGFIKAFKGFLRHELLRHGPQVTDVPTTRDVMHFLGSLGWMQYVGAGVCLYSSVHQYRCHEILASLRRDDKSGQCRPPFSYKYGIPRGDWFEFVSSAHYLAEIGFYGGLLIASGANTHVMWILFVSVVANLYLLAKPTHEWYLSKFEDYPKTRHALFPSFRQNRAKD
jgi:3-oxo-5-alpha-steroid 4-dehydrogenase 3